MFNDNGINSLKRQKKNNKQTKSRLSQKINNFIGVNSYSIDPMKRYSSVFFKIDAGDVYIDYSKENPENKKSNQYNFSYGNTEQEYFVSFNDNILKDELRQKQISDQYIDSTYIEYNKYTKSEYKNSKIDVLKRNPKLTEKYENLDFKFENKDYLKVSTDVSNNSKKMTSTLIEMYHDNYDIKDPFVDDSHSNDLETGVYISIKNCYNNGNMKNYEEKDSVKCNSIINTKNAVEGYYRTGLVFSSSGFVYNTKTPDSIAFGGLKR